MRTDTGHKLTLFDSTCLIVGIIVGAGIYKFAPQIASCTSSSWGFLSLWIAGGFLSFAGALCYAELATTFSQSGGDIIYLKRAYGGWAGFLFGWSQLTVTRPADIATMSLVFSTFACLMFGDSTASITFLNVSLLKWVAVAVVLLLTLINLGGIQPEKWTQNLLAVLTILGILFILLLVLFQHHDTPVENPDFQFQFPISVAMILVLFTYGGWMEIVYVSSDVYQPGRNILKSILLGLGTVVILYLLLNLSFLYTLGHTGMAASNAVATETVATFIPRYATPVITLLICVSALSSTNGLIFTGSRISEALGREYSLFKYLHPLPKMNATEQSTPVLALLLQAIIAIAIIFCFGSALETIIYMAAVVYTFYMATTLSVIVLRYKEPHLPRPYQVTGYPFTPLLFAAVCAFLIYGAMDYKPIHSLVAYAIVLLGLPIYLLSGINKKI